MPKIFISYRRGDSAGHAGRLFDHLSRDFSRDHVFMDVAGIQPGVDFVEAIDQAVGACDVLLVVIGPDWARCTDAHGKRRLEDPNDFVALETATALKRKVLVVPVLVQGASLPHDSELPERLKTLLRRNAYEVRDTRWDADVRALSEALAQVDRAHRSPSGRPSPRAIKWVAALVVAAGAAGTWGFVSQETAIQTILPAKVEPPPPGPVIVPTPAPEPVVTDPIGKPPPTPEPAPDAPRPKPATPPTASSCKRIAGLALYAFDGRAESWQPLNDPAGVQVSTGRDGCEGSGALAIRAPAGVRDAGAGVFVEPQGSRKDWTGKSRLHLSLRSPRDAAPFGKLQVYVISDAYRCTCDWTRASPKLLDGDWHEVRLPLARGDCQSKAGGACSIELADIDQIGIKLFGTVASTTLYVDHLSLD